MTAPQVDLYDLDHLRQALSDTRYMNLQRFPTIDSTNVFAMQQAQAGAPEGSVYLADQQTAGRGRGGHAWHSAHGDGIYVSILLRPRMALQQALWLSLAAGMAVQSAIAGVTGLHPDIRWPNDILIGALKCSGILVETASEDGLLSHAVIGIGINVNQQEFPADIATLATSLYRETGRSWPRQDILIALLRALDHEMALLQAEFAAQLHAPGILDRFRAASSWVSGKPVTVAEGEGYTGVTAGLNQQGYLLVRDVHGALRTVLSGGVRAR